MSVDAFLAAPTATRRDHWGRYLVVPPKGGKPTGFSRATTIAKILDSEAALMPWKATLSHVGALRRPGLMARWQQLIAEHPDPWYSSDESKKAAKALVEECALAGGSADRAEIGNLVHKLIEYRLKGQKPNFNVEPWMAADLAAFDEAMAAHGITFDMDYLEAMVVLDEYQVAGRADALCAHHPEHGNVVIDFKTGASLTYAMPAISIQLAIYANADNVYHQGADADGSLDRREPMPDVRKDVALVVHLPAGEARCDLYLLDISKGYEAFDLAMQVRRWRSTRKLATKIPATPVPVAPSELPSDVDAAGSSMATPTSPTGGRASRVPSSAGTPVAADEAPEPDPAPAPVPSRTPADEQAIVRSRPAPDEGDEVDDVTFGVLEARYKALVPVARSWVNQLASEATRGGVPFHSKDNHTRRRWEILRALTVLAEADNTDDDVRGLLWPIVGDCALFLHVTVGHLVGSLSVDEAITFGRLVTGELAVVVGDDGQPSVVAA